MNRKLYMAWLAAALFLLGAGQALGAEGKAAPKEIPDTPKAVQVDRQTAVSIEHRGTDDVGARLVFHLKEIFNRSSLFKLTAKDEKKLRMIVTTRDEFQGRPGLSSAYAVAWLYSETEETLKYYLSGDVGLVASNGVEQAAEALAAETEKVSAKYSYLFE
jgi:hypothetical protein